LVLANLTFSLQSPTAFVKKKFADPRTVLAIMICGIAVFLDFVSQ